MSPVFFSMNTMLMKKYIKCQQLSIFVATN